MSYEGWRFGPHEGATIQLIVELSQNTELACRKTTRKQVGAVSIRDYGSERGPMLFLKEHQDAKSYKSIATTAWARRDEVKPIAFGILPVAIRQVRQQNRRLPRQLDSLSEDQEALILCALLSKRMDTLSEKGSVSTEHKELVRETTEFREAENKRRERN